MEIIARFQRACSMLEAVEVYERVERMWVVLSL